MKDKQKIDDFDGQLSQVHWSSKQSTPEKGIILTPFDVKKKK